jgi:hypothetical protein
MTQQLNANPIIIIQVNIQTRVANDPQSSPLAKATLI